MKTISFLILTILFSFSNSNASAKSPNAIVLETEKKLQVKIGGKLSIRYPSFLKEKKLKNKWIRLFHTIPYKHEQYQDGKYGVTAKDTYTDFDLRIKLYPSIDNALDENHLNDYLEGYLDDNDLRGKALLESINQLVSSSIEPIQKIKNGYSIRVGVEGVGSYYYLIIKHNGVLLFDFPYNINPVKSLQKNKPLNILSDKDKNKLAQTIFESTTSIKKSDKQTKKIQEFVHSKPLIFSTDKEKKEEFTPLGFNKNKNFAYLNQLFSDGAGCNYLSFNIVDLSNDKNLVNMETPPDSCYLDDHKNIEKQFMLKIKNKLKIYNISSNKPMNLNKFPVVTAGSEFNICLSKKTKELAQETMEQDISKHLINIIAYNREGGSKEIGGFEEVTFEGARQIYNPKVEGYFKNPNFNRLAVIISYSVKGTDGPPNFRRVKIFGSTLAIKKGAKTDKPCTQLATKPDIGSIKKTKKALVTSLQKNTKIIKPKKAEPIKTAKGSSSFTLLASMFGLLSLRLKNIL